MEMTKRAFKAMISAVTRKGSPDPRVFLSEDGWLVATNGHVLFCVLGEPIEKSYDPETAVFLDVGSLKSLGGLGGRKARFALQISGETSVTVSVFDGPALTETTVEGERFDPPPWKQVVEGKSFKQDCHLYRVALDYAKHAEVFASEMGDGDNTLARWKHGNVWFYPRHGRVEALVVIMGLTGLDEATGILHID